MKGKKKREKKEISVIFFKSDSYVSVEIDDTTKIMIG